MSTPSETPISTPSDTPMPSQGAGKAVRPTCPRCGYDQSGEVARWTESCPVKGTCPECGLEFAWDAAFFPERQKLTWLIEHAPSRWRAVGALFLTLFRLTLPWMFWSKVGLHHAVSISRLIVWLGFWLFAVWIPVHITTLIVVCTLPNQYSQGGGSMLPDWFASLLHPFFNTHLTEGYEEPLDIARLAPAWQQWSSMSWSMLLLWLVPAGIILLLASSRRTARIKRVHLFRSFVYASWPWFVWNALSAVAVALHYVTYGIGNSFPRADWIADLHEFSSSARFFLSGEHEFVPWGYGSLISYQAPTIMFCNLWLLVYWFFAIRRGFQLKHPVAVWLACVIIALLLSVLCQLLLGDITHKPFWGLWSIYR